jgi:hypothetical protein
VRSRASFRFLSRLVPGRGFEPLTNGLQNRIQSNSRR